MRQFDAIAYDVDGTLVDSFPKHADAEVLAAQAMGVDIANVDWAQFRGFDRTSLWGALAPNRPEEAQAFDDTADEHFNQILDDPASPLLPIPQAFDFVTFARTHIPSAVQVTNSVRSNLDAMNNQLGWSDLFTTTVAYEDTPNPKPDPHPYLEASRRMNIPTERIIAVEDSVTGIRSGQRAGMYVVAIASMSDMQSLRGTGADLVVQNYQHFAQWLSSQ